MITRNTEGWDIDDRSVAPCRCIEVDGRRDQDVIFYLSENGWDRRRDWGRDTTFSSGLRTVRCPFAEVDKHRAREPEV
jgi:hypothetical protein